MTVEQQRQFEKFKEFARWMYEDSKAAFYKAGAKFLVAMAVLNYVETLGAFKMGYWRKDSKSKTSGDERFKSFLSYLGEEYRRLVERHPEIYEELRNGFTHEFLPKTRNFIVYHTYKSRMELVVADSSSSSYAYMSSDTICGILFEDDTWKIIVSKLLEDFEKGVKKFISEIEKDENEVLAKNFFETADQINMQNFRI